MDELDSLMTGLRKITDAINMEVYENINIRREDEDAQEGWRKSGLQDYHSSLGAESPSSSDTDLQEDTGDIVDLEALTSDHVSKDPHAHVADSSETVFTRNKHLPESDSKEFQCSTRLDKSRERKVFVSQKSLLDVVAEERVEDTTSDRLVEEERRHTIGSLSRDLSDVHTLEELKAVLRETFGLIEHGFQEMRDTFDRLSRPPPPPPPPVAPPPPLAPPKSPVKPIRKHIQGPDEVSAENPAVERANQMFADLNEKIRMRSKRPSLEEKYKHLK